MMNSASLACKIHCRGLMYILMEIVLGMGIICRLPHSAEDPSLYPKAVQQGHSFCFIHLPLEIWSNSEFNPVKKTLNLAIFQSYSYVIHFP
jgi:hypothetical protein